MITLKYKKICFALTFVLLILLSTLPVYALDYSLWFSTSDFNTAEKTQDILQFLGDGKFDFIVITAAKMQADNTLLYSYSTLSNIISAVKTAYPQIKVYADIYSFAGKCHCRN